MKRSSKAALLLTTLYIAGALVCDLVLASTYRTTALDDPFKNFSRIPVRSFNNLKIRGGNGYAVEIRHGKNYEIMLMNSRKSFFKIRESSDTVQISFDVANQNYQSSKDCTVGLIIIAPNIKSLKLDGTNNIINSFITDTMEITQTGKTITRMHNSEIGNLVVNARQESAFDFETRNKIKTLTLQLENRSSLVMNGINFEEFRPLVKDSAHLIFYKNAFDLLQKLKAEY